MTFWFYAWLGTAVLLCVSVWVGDRALTRVLRITEDALAGWRRCEDHWRNTIAELQLAEERIAELLKGDDWRGV